MRLLLPAVIAVVCLLARTVAGSQNEAAPAAALWEQAIAAKGGRARLHEVRSLAILETTRFRRPVRGIAERRVDMIVTELPDKWWEFLDYRPGAMGHSVHVVDTRTGSGWSTIGGNTPRPLLRPDTHAAFRLRELQCVYLMETRWVQPIPLRATRVKRGFKMLDRVETRVDDDVVIYDLDPRSHLPIHIEVAHRITATAPRPSVRRTGVLKYSYEIDSYQEVAGLRVPARLKRGADRSEARVEVNPDYKRSIFIEPPSPDADINSWRRLVVD